MGKLATAHSNIPSVHSFTLHLASNLESDNGVTTLCIPNKENSAQGQLWSQTINKCGLVDGDKFLLRVVGGCERYINSAAPCPGEVTWLLAHPPPPPPPPPTLPRKRAEEPGPDNTLLISDFSNELVDLYGDGTFLYVAADIGELYFGTYHLKVQIDGVVKRLVVLDNQGTAYAR